MSKHTLEKTVLIMARNQILAELRACGQNGGVGKANSYAPILVALDGAFRIVERLEAEELEIERTSAADTATSDQAVADRMAAVRAARKSN